jgi:hypothetical protein
MGKSSNIEMHSRRKINMPKNNELEGSQTLKT